jgi:2',3'-cyclic-nucleotide 2'-phosphodiesterase (5'-nucleotidase family)
MSNYIKAFGVLFIVLASSTFFFCKASAVSEPKSLTILFTHDLHDHMLPNKTENGNISGRIGGYTRIKTVLDKLRDKNGNSILVDAGDYSMGDLFQTVFDTDAPELRIMGKMGYDVTTFGNHEFDYRDSGLARHLYSAKLSGEKLPQIVCGNLSFPEEKNMPEPLSGLQKAMQSYGVRKYTVIERDGIKIGVFGLMGEDAASSAPMTGVVFQNTIKSAEAIVKKLRNKEKADIIICLSHSGTSEDYSQSEDEILAKKVLGIDIIISGHSHTTLQKPIIAGNTIIGSCGQYGYNLGSISVQQTSAGHWKLQEYRLLPIGQDIDQNQQINAEINKFKGIVQKNYLDRFDLGFDEILARTQFSFVPSDEIGVRHREEPLGNLIADGYIYSVKKAEGEKYEPVSAAIVTAGTVRGTFLKGDITVEDAFISSPLGIGVDGVAGYPLISAYLTGRELRDLCEVDASISPIYSSAQMYMSGIGFTFNPNRLIFNRVTELHLRKQNGEQEKIDPSKLYRIVTGLYNAQMLSIIGDKSFGILSVVPKTEAGEPVKNYEERIIYNKLNGKNEEIKEWLSTARYLKSFDKIDGVATVPAYYSKTQSRKIVDDNKSILAILSAPNRFAIKIYILVIVLVMVLALLAVRLLKYHKVKKKKGINI